MAAKGLAIDHNTFCCSICLDLLKIPVTIPCGHSYCMDCINVYWDGEVSRTYSCPQCRQKFSQRPVLVKNTMLAVLMEGLKKSEAPAAPRSPSSAAHTDVSCDLCSGRKVKAVKSCLQCLVSYCKEHLQPHYDVAALKKHKLVQPTESLLEKMCSQHDEVMKMFCRTDQQCICYLCSVDQHKGHDTVTAAAERTEKQRELQAKQQNLLQTIHLKEEAVDGLREQLKISRGSADAAVEHSDKSLKELLRLLEQRLSEVKQQVRSQQEAEELRVKELQDNVQQEITELKKTLSELDTLSHTEDHVLFLHKLSSLSKVTMTAHSPMIRQAPPPFQDMVTAAVSKLKSELQHISLLDPPAVVHKTNVNAPKTNATGAQATALSQSSVSQCFQPQSIQMDPPQQQSPEDLDALVRKLNLNDPKGYLFFAPPIGAPWEEQWSYFMQACRWNRGTYYGQRPPPPFEDTEEWPTLPKHNGKIKAKAPNPAPCPSVSKRASLRKHIRALTWDQRSLFDKLELSEENLLVRHVQQSQNYRNHPYRFTRLPQAVSRETLTGKFFFEVVCPASNFGSVTVGVCYTDIKRDGFDAHCNLGMNAKSWMLECYRERSVFWHNGARVEILGGGGMLVGVFVDHKAGILSFYRCLDAKLIYMTRTTFTQPLLAAVRLNHIQDRAYIWNFP